MGTGVPTAVNIHRHEASPRGARRRPPRPPECCENRSPSLPRGRNGPSGWLTVPDRLLAGRADPSTNERHRASPRSNGDHLPSASEFDREMRDLVVSLLSLRQDCGAGSSSGSRRPAARRSPFAVEVTGAPPRPPSPRRRSVPRARPAGEPPSGSARPQRTFTKPSTLSLRPLPSRGT